MKGEDAFEAFRLETPAFLNGWRGVAFGARPVCGVNGENPLPQKGGSVMHALLLLLPLGPGNRAVAEELGDRFSRLHQSAEGFKGETFLVDDAAGEYGSLSLWASREDVDAFRQAAGPRLQEALGGIVQGPPTIRLFEVYEPKA